MTSVTVIDGPNYCQQQKMQTCLGRLVALINATTKKQNKVHLTQCLSSEFGEGVDEII